MSGIKVEVMIANQPTETTFKFARQLEQLLHDAGADVMESTAMFYVPRQGVLLHKGLTFDIAPKYEAAVDSLAKALGNAGIVPCRVPSYEGQSDKIQIVVTSGSEVCH
jgi:hypothetical protein